MESITLSVAFLAGIFSFLSPCVLPLVPGYISFISGISFEDLSKAGLHKKVMIRSGVTAIFFVLGFSVVFVALGASATLLGQFLVKYIQILTKIAGVIIVILGLHLTGVISIPWLNYQKKMNVERVSSGIAGAFLVGFAFAFGWTPCIGPILGGILTLAAGEKTVTKGILLLSAYSLGLGIPFIATGFAIGVFMKFVEKYRKFIRWGEIVAGVFLVALGVLVFFDKLSVIAYYIESVSGGTSP